MKFSAIIAEYNPLTKGHLKHIEITKKELKLPLIVIMSGTFTQRGKIAVLDKYDRANLAIKAGADVVIELPAVFSLSPASDFAFGAIKILDKLGCVEYLSFGSECGSIEKLKHAANELINLEKTESFKQKTKSGLSYSSNISSEISTETSKIFNKPNNTLAIEYLKAIIKLNSKIKPYTISRNDNYNNDTELSDPSASAIRKLIYDGKISKAKELLPDFEASYIDKICIEKLMKIDDILYANLLNTDEKDLNIIDEVIEGLEYRIIKNARENTNLLDTLKCTYTKRYKDTKIDRIIVKNYLKISRYIQTNSKLMKPYAKILAIDSNIKNEFLKQINKNKITLITKVSDIKKMSKNQIKVYNIDTKSETLSVIAHNKKLTNLYANKI